MRKGSLYELCVASMLLGILIIGAKLVIPFGVISFTMQLPVIFLIIFTMRKKMAILIVFTYLFLGLLGLPVFSAGGGIDYIYKPSFGFILGFLFSAILVPKRKNLFTLVIGVVIGLLAVYVTGVIYMYSILNYYMGKSVTVSYVISAGVTPFIVKDLILAFVASSVALRLNQIAGMNEKEDKKLLNLEKLI